MGGDESMDDEDAEFDDDDDDYDEIIIMENTTHCPECDDKTGHAILRERKVGKGTDFLLKCDECDKVHSVQVREPKAIEISFVLSEGAHSRVAKIEIDEDEIIWVGDVFEHDEAHWEINRLESKDGRSKTNLIVGEISRANAVRSDQVLVRLTLTKTHVSKSDSITVPRDTEFKAGSIMEHWDQRWRIRAIHTGTGRTMTGRVVAHDIKRIYLHEPPRASEDAPHTPRERRQAWKEGRLGDNPNPIIPDAEKSGKSKSKRPGRRQKKARN
jgi:uncharacterized Zn finger protein